MASAVFELCERYVTGQAALDPVWGTMRGVAGAAGVSTDYGPEGIRATAATSHHPLRPHQRATPAAHPEDHEPAPPRKTHSGTAVIHTVNNTIESDHARLKTRAASRRRISQTVEGSNRWPSPTNSRWILRSPARIVRSHPQQQLPDGRHVGGRPPRRGTPRHNRPVSDAASSGHPQVWLVRSLVSGQ